MRNITDLNRSELADLGKQTQQAIIKLMAKYDENDKKDVILNKELFSFEFTDNGKKEWVQAVIGVITEPVLFHEHNSVVSSWISTKMHLKMTEQMCNCFLEMIDVLEANVIKFETGQQLIKIVENNFVLLAEQLNNVKEI
jgi:hypothetical protein